MDFLECPYIMKARDEIDVRRRKDGMLATIVNKPKSFMFVVWHERFPEYNPKYRVTSKHVPVNFWTNWFIITMLKLFPYMYQLININD